MLRALVIPLMLLASPAWSGPIPVEEDYASVINAVDLVADRPTHVFVMVPKTEVYTHLPDPNMTSAYAMGGPIAGGIAGVIDSQVRKVQAPHLAQFNARLQSADWTSILTEAIKGSLSTSPLTNIVSVSSQPTTEAARSAAGRTPDQVAALWGQVRLNAGHTALDINLVARIGEGKSALASPGQARRAYSQVLSYRIDNPVRGAVGERSSYWSSLAPSDANQMIVSGLKELADMLAYDLAMAPKKGRQAGKQIALGTTYGIVETTRGTRVWIRGRDGRLTSLARPSGD